MIEYLYVDIPRLDSYYEQISLPVEYDKVPVWKFALGIGGPKIEGTQTRSARPPTEHEKIQKFLKHIDQNDLIASERDFSNDRSFMVEALSARRSVISMDGRRLVIWVAISSEQQDVIGGFPQGALFLIEDYRGRDEYPRMLSGYSSLYLLIDELAWLNKKSDAHPIKTLREQDEATRQFAIDPIGTLESIGAKIGPEQRIKATYRLRASCIEMKGQQDRAITTIGYPIIIQQDVVSI